LQVLNRTNMLAGCEPAGMLPAPDANHSRTQLVVACPFQTPPEVSLVEYRIEQPSSEQASGQSAAAAEEQLPSPLPVTTVVETPVRVTVGHAISLMRWVLLPEHGQGLLIVGAPTLNNTRSLELSLFKETEAREFKVLDWRGLPLPREAFPMWADCLEDARGQPPLQHAASDCLTAASAHSQTCCAWNTRPCQNVKS
jgi:hypothetical protein